MSQHRKAGQLSPEPAERDCPEQLLDQAAQWHRAGDRARAEEIYRQVLARDPNHPDALQLLGVIALDQGRHDEAEKLIRQALRQAPGSAALHTNLGNVHQARGRLEEAIRCYEAALTHDGEYALAYLNLAIAHHRQSRLAAAIGYYRFALALDPNSTTAHFNLADACQRLGDLNGAIGHYRAAIAQCPQHVDAHLNLGNVLRDSGDGEQALACYQTALRLDPQHAVAHNHIGLIHAQRGELPEAIRCYRRALELKPTFAGTQNNLGNALKALREHEEACTCYRRAIELKPDFAEAYNNLAATLKEQGKLNEAIANYQQAIHCRKNYPSAHTGLTLTLLETCDWSGHNQRVKKLQRITERALGLGKPSPVNAFSALSLPFPQTLKRAIAQNYAQTVDEGMRPLRSRLRRNRGRADGRIRIGYASPNFRNHPTSHLMVRLFELHDRERFEIFTYTWSSDDGSEYRRRIAQHSDHFVDVSGESFFETAQRIADDGIDILVDRAGFTRDCRAEIFALRPAPVQVNYIGFPGTLGANFIDYIITDPVVTPPELEHQLTEKAVLLPGCYLVTDPKPPRAPSAPSRAECGLPEDGFVYCCFNTSYKIDPEIFDVWARILQHVPDSVLWLMRSSREAERNLRREAEARGVAAQRLVFADKLSKDRHLARHHHASLFLDTPLYNAHTTAVDTLWAGVPLVTVPGQTFASRVAASTLQAIGVPELIARDLQQYEEIAVTLGHSPTRLADIKDMLAATRATYPLFDAERYCRNLEAAYLRMWEIHAAGGDPQRIVVSGQDRP